MIGYVFVRKSKWRMRRVGLIKEGEVWPAPTGAAGREITRLGEWKQGGNKEGLGRRMSGESYWTAVLCRRRG